MKKIIILIAILCSLGLSKTINLIDWKPEYKYKSEDTYTLDEAEAYCKDKKQCYPKREIGRKYRIYQKINNCPSMLTGKMDSYIASAWQIRVFIIECYDKTLYKAVKIGKYGVKRTSHISGFGYGYDYVWKIEKTAKAGVKFNLNKQ